MVRSEWVWGKERNGNKSKNKIQESLPLSEGDMFQDTQWMSDSTKPNFFFLIQ